jgi:glycosyltransferase involved in cell wall biosynthesis
MPKVSVIIPAYNAAPYTVEAIESVLNQTFKDFEIIVVDDGSTDNTKELLQPYVDDCRINYIYKENGGASSARNMGIRASKGQYIACLDCDDLWLPEKLEICTEFLENNPKIGLVYTRVFFIDSHGNNVGTSGGRCKSGMIFEKLIVKNFIMNSTPVVKKECFTKVGLFDESVFHPADWDMWLRISEHYPIIYLDKILTKYRIRESRYFERNIEHAKSEIFRVLEKTFRLRTYLPKKLKRKAISNVSFESAKAYARKLNLKNARKEAFKAVKLCPYNVKYYLLFILLFLSIRLRSIIYPKLFAFKN